MILHFKFIYVLFCIIFLICSCIINDDFDRPPIVCNDTELVSNSSVQGLLEMNLSNFVPTLITQDIVVQGRVISSDRQGNFFKTLSIQNKKEGRGFQIELDVNDLYIKFPIGQKVLLRAKNLFISKQSGVLKLGHTYQDNGRVRVGRIQQTLVDKFVFRACDDVSLVEPKAFRVISDVMKDEYLNTLITLEKVQFARPEKGKNYAEEDRAGNRILEDSSGRQIILRTSSFATFADESPPEGSGKITAVLGKFLDDYQLYIRSLDDIQMNDNRFVIAPAPATSVQFVSASATVIEETSATYHLGLAITNPSVNNATRVYVALSIGDPSDINSFARQAVRFPANSFKSQMIEIDITDDELAEKDEEFIFQLENISGGNDATIGQNSSFTLTIRSLDTVQDLSIQINEFHYDNTGRDKNEFVEIRIGGNKDSQPANLDDFTVALYNGENGEQYRTKTLDKLIRTCDYNHCYYLWETPIQNGPDGLAISGPSVEEFLSYKGVFDATGGIVSGVRSTDIGVIENGETPLGASLQIDPRDGKWKLSAKNTKGQENIIKN